MVEIRTVSEEDIPELAALIREFAVFEKLDHICDVTEQSLADAIFGKSSTTHCIVAVAEGNCIGYALFYPVFKSFRGVHSMYLEDLYVTPRMRGKGAGLALFKAVARRTAEAGFSRMDWQVLRWNTEAAVFYEALGAQHDDENLNFRLMGGALQDLLK